VATTRLFCTAVALLGATLGAAATGPEPAVSVRERGGAYVVAVRFTVPEPAATVRAVLTDYANIPRFMPGIRTSRVLDRDGGVVRVEQEAVSKYLMFSKRVHLVLDVEERAGEIRFQNNCTRSFHIYEGAWRIADSEGVTEVRYELTASPSFNVPGFVLRRLLDRDARAMIDGLRAEISGRAAD
jgi:ribosome-associated toxin RatA of RatAB toxin-antitoxin module